MGWFWRPTAVVLNITGAIALAIAAGAAAATSTDHPLLAQLEAAEDLAALEAVQTQVKQQFQSPSLRLTRDVGALEPYFDLVTVATEADRRVALETTAEQDYNQALDLARAAIRVRDRSRARDGVTLEALEEQEALWGEAIAHLRAIPQAVIFVVASPD
jgi:hypothetical protein